METHFVFKGYSLIGNKSHMEIITQRRKEKNNLSLFKTFSALEAENLLPPPRDDRNLNSRAGKCTALFPKSSVISLKQLLRVAFGKGCTTGRKLRITCGLYFVEDFHSFEECFWGAKGKSDL